jgi:hypothetical protein
VKNEISTEEIAFEGMLIQIEDKNLKDLAMTRSVESPSSNNEDAYMSNNIAVVREFRLVCQFRKLQKPMPNPNPYS